MLKKVAIPILVAGSIVFLAFQLGAVDSDPHQPEPKEQCPVCGMYVANYPSWLAQVTFKDNNTVFFDGAKDMFKFLFNVKKYMPKKDREDVTEIFLTGYYDLKPVRAEDAFLVIGSDIFGPMGHELVAFASELEAQEFFIDHKGGAILRLGNITPEVIGKLD